MESTSYKRLDAAKSEVRLIEILSDGDDGGLVNCKLYTVSLDESPAFAALSYVWGDVEGTMDIILDGRTMSVTRNLESALHYVHRHWTREEPGRPPSSFRLWADAICVNQNDLEERASQVQLMRRVYESADLVLFWLGPNDWSLAFSTIETIADEIMQCEDEQTFFELTWMKKYPELCQGGDENSNQIIKVSLEAVDKLLNNSYWKRVWILQEVVLAGRLLLVGTSGYCLNWIALHVVWFRLDSLRKSIKDTLRRKPTFISTTVWNFITSNLLMWNRIRVIALVRNNRTYETTMGPENKWDSWLVSTYGGELEASDPKDHIYGLLGITKLDITPDYSTHKSVSDVYTEYVVAWLEAKREPGIPKDKFHPLYFLKMAGIGLFERTVGFPTWAPNYFENSKQRMLPSPSSTVGIANRDVFEGFKDEYPTYASRRRVYLFEE